MLHGEANASPERGFHAPAQKGPAMTINVALKCPDGIVLCADSLVTISAGGPPISIIPYYAKLFPIGKYLAGAMLNGAGSVGSRTIEDLVGEFGQTYHAPIDNYSLQQFAQDLGYFVQGFIVSGADPLLEIIVAGYSAGAAACGRRFGEIYSVLWENAPWRLRVLYATDTEFGTHYGGQPQALDRFRYGIDDWIIADMLTRRQALFTQVHDYMLEQLRARGIIIPPGTTVPMPGLTQFDVIRLVSDYVLGPTPGQTVKNIKEGMLQRFETMERFFSLQVAVDYCTFLASCAYAVNNFTFQIPGVGSEMRVATVTKEQGFQFHKVWTVTPSDIRIP